MRFTVYNDVHGFFKVLGVRLADTWVILRFYCTSMILCLSVCCVFVVVLLGVVNNNVHPLLLLLQGHAMLVERYPS